jgi:hypothetical protein
MSFLACPNLLDSVVVGISYHTFLLMIQAAKVNVAIRAYQAFLDDF